MYEEELAILSEATLEDVNGVLVQAVLAYLFRQHRSVFAQESANGGGRVLAECVVRVPDVLGGSNRIAVNSGQELPEFAGNITGAGTLARQPR